MSITLSKQQSKAAKKVEAWLEKNHPNDFTQQVFRIDGYAGTGKTTIQTQITNHIDEIVLFAAFTGKAALRMRQAGAKNASTLHSLIYDVDTDAKGKPIFSLSDTSPLINARLLVIDEHSMISEELGNDICSFKIPILALGDPGQLPPVKGTGFFMKRFADVTLTEVHRQALDSPIIRIATRVRTGGQLVRESVENLSVYSGKVDPSEFDQMLTGRNNTRERLNSRYREILGVANKPFPQKGEKIICLRNSRPHGLFNGMIGTTTKKSKLVPAHDEFPEFVQVTFENDDKKILNIRAHSAGFRDDSLLAKMDRRDRRRLQELTWGYAITVHKSQGSEWDNVLVIDDGFLTWKPAMRRRWLYTAITRASKSLTIARLGQK